MKLSYALAVVFLTDWSSLQVPQLVFDRGMKPPTTSLHSGGMPSQFVDPSFVQISQRNGGGGLLRYRWVSGKLSRMYDTQASGLLMLILQGFYDNSDALLPSRHV